MSRRLELHEIFADILGTRGEKETRVYFQPPSTVKMKYPCIVYSRSQVDTKYANNHLYTHKDAYTVIAINPNPDSEIPDKLLNLPLSSFSRAYTADNLNHDVFNIYY